MSRGILKKFYFFVGTLILCILVCMFVCRISDLKQCSWEPRYSAGSDEKNHRDSEYFFVCIAQKMLSQSNKRMSPDVIVLLEKKFPNYRKRLILLGCAGVGAEYYRNVGSAVHL